MNKISGKNTKEVFGWQVYWKMNDANRTITPASFIITDEEELNKFINDARTVGNLPYEVYDIVPISIKENNWIYYKKNTPMTDIMKQYAKDNNVPVLELSLPTVDVADFKGLPVRLENE